jgi:VCPO second helical-bundle domain
MNYRISRRISVFVLPAVLFWSAGYVQAQSPATDPVLEWNANMIEATSTATTSGLIQSRWAAIVHVSIFDAVNSFTGDAEPYRGMQVTPQAGATVEAAVIAAAHYALVHLLPDQQSTLDTQYASSLAARRLATSDPGIEVGEKAAAAVLALRANDGSAAAQFPYTAPGSGNPGVWTPTPPALAPALLPGWGKVTPWVIRTQSQFRVGPPPALNSELYAMDVNEVKGFGAQNSSMRIGPETDIAMWWVSSAVILWNPIARQAVTARGLSISQSARVFALLNMAAADAAIACWDSKYAYNFWRPISAIRSADGYRVTPDANWVPFLATPAYPEYPSGHNEISGAMAQALISLFGDKPEVTMLAHSPAHESFDHLWFRFSQGIDEVINTRVWEGIHFRYSDEQGMHAGRCLGQFVVRHALQQRRRGTQDPASDDDLGCDDLGGSQSNDASAARALRSRRIN